MKISTRCHAGTPWSKLAPSLAILALVGATPPVCAANDTALADGSRAGRGAASRIEVLSSDPLLVSGGSALVRVTLPHGVAKKAVVISVAGRDMSSRFKEVTPGELLGLIDGLPVGASSIDVVPTRGAALATSLPLRNWPIEGPIISGAHQSPYFCQTQLFTLPDGTKLGAPLDANCSVASRVHYLYRAATGGALKLLPSTAQLPADVGMTTTLSGTTMPFVVRVETGTVDRGIYQSAVLHDPTQEAEPAPLATPRGWNRRLVAIEGFGCPGGWYIQGAAQGNLAFAGFDFSLLSVQRLGEGYAMFANTLQHASNNCNAVLASEAAMMSKEHFIKRHGVPEFTVSAGCSGGSYGSTQPADRMPGLFDGVLILCTFPDPLSIALTGSDGHLITHFTSVTQPVAFTASQIVAISGHKGFQAFIDAANQAGRTDPVPGRVDIPGYVSAPFNASVPSSVRYDPVVNRTGIRGTVYDAAKNIYGVDPVTGFALRPFDNVGVQYGLGALAAGAISFRDFLLLNEGIGGYDQDFNYVPARSVGDAGAMRRAQQSGLQLGGNGGLATIPVFDVTGIYNDDSGYHYQWFHFALRERLMRMNWNADNHVMWRGNPVPAADAWNAFIRWVVAVKADKADGTQREKVVRNKPIQDGCYSGTTFIAEPQTLSSAANSMCNALYPSWTSPRLVAGGPVAANIMKCALKPVSRGDYGSISDIDFARLNAIFPTGVCDWTQAGGLTGVVPNGSFGPSPINLISVNASP
jgi:hypothetical protein